MEAGVSILELILAGTVGHEAVRDGIAGDLIEERDDIARTRGRLAASIWLARQVIFSLADFASLRRTSGAECFDLSFARRFYTVLVALVVIGSGLALATEAAGAAGAVALAGAVVLDLIAGFVVAAIARKAPLVAAFGLALIVLGIGVGALLMSMSRGPLWYWTLTQALVVPVTLIGALIRVRQVELRRLA